MAKIQVSGELNVVTTEGKLADALQIVDSRLNMTQQRVNQWLQGLINNKADAGSAVEVKLSGAAVAHYPSDEGITFREDGYYLLDATADGLGAVIATAKNGRLTYYQSPSDGDTYIISGSGQLWVYGAGWKSCGRLTT